MMKVVELLRRAKDKISNGLFSKDDRDQWDVSKALSAEEPALAIPQQEWLGAYDLAHDLLKKAINNNPVAFINDTFGRSRNDVVSIFEKAISYAEVMTQPPPPQQPKPWWARLVERVVEWSKSLFIKCLP
jgi:hypothetical protein